MSTVAFFIFGIALIYFGFTEDEENIDEKFKSVQKDINESMSYYSIDAFDEENGETKPKKRGACTKFLSKLLAHTGVKLFLMVLMSEMGDRS